MESLIVYAMLKRGGPLHSWRLMLGGLFYPAFLFGAAYVFS